MMDPVTEADVDRQSILIIEDDDVYRERLVRAFEDRGFEASGAPDGEQGLGRARAESPELALVDLRMPGMSGLEVVRELHGIDETTKIIVLTAYGSIATALDAMRLGAVHYLTKPAEMDEILQAFSRNYAERPSEADLEPSYDPLSLARVEWEHINRVLSDCGGNISRAARVLKIHRRSLQRKLAKYPPSA